jgi:putative oxidoreductase
MRSVGLFISRVIFGSYLAVHGAQKLFGSFGGHGLEATGAGFESLGMRPGGGVLTAAGIADPLGPLVIAGTMVVASTVHRKQGPLSTNGGYELPLTNFALATALLTAGPGNLRLGPHLSKSLTRLSVVGGAVLAGYSLNQLLKFQPELPAAEEAADEELVEPS